jgi:hypothetical protein
MDFGSGIRKKPIPDPGSRGQKATGSRIRIRNTAIPDPQHCLTIKYNFRTKILLFVTARSDHDPSTHGSVLVLLPVSGTVLVRIEVKSLVRICIELLN